jgi:hypothetical protein
MMTAQIHIVIIMIASLRRRPSSVDRGNGSHSRTLLMHRFPWVNITAVIVAVAALGVIAVKNSAGNGPAELLNVFYDPTRELYQHINAQFAAHQENADGKPIAVRRSHGGSSYQVGLVTSGELRPTWPRSNTWSADRKLVSDRYPYAYPKESW